jgi:hypothetical protein
LPISNAITDLAGVSGKDDGELEDAGVAVRLSDAVADLLRHTASDPRPQIDTDKP